MIRGFIAPFLCALVFASTGCGPGDDETTGAAERPISGSSAAVLIEAYGDSTTEGYTVTDGIGKINPENQIVVLQDMLRQRFGPSVTVNNEGVGSTQASQLLNGTDGRHPIWAQQMAQSKADIIMIEYGLNDTYFFANPRDGLESESPDRFEKILVELVTTAKNTGKQVVLVEPGPSCNPFREPTLAYYVMRIDRVAKQLDVPLVQHYWPTIERPDWQSLLSDCTHPTTQLYAAHAKSSYAVVAPIVEKLMHSARAGHAQIGP